MVGFRIILLWGTSVFYVEAYIIRAKNKKADEVNYTALKVNARG